MRRIFRSNIDENRKPRSIIEIGADIATILIIVSIPISMYQTCKQQSEFNKSFTLAQNQYNYQLKVDSERRIDENLQKQKDQKKEERDSTSISLLVAEYLQKKKENLIQEINNSPFFVIREIDSSKRSNENTEFLNIGVRRVLLKSIEVYMISYDIETDKYEISIVDVEKVGSQLSRNEKIVFNLPYVKSYFFITFKYDDYLVDKNNNKDSLFYQRIPPKDGKIVDGMYSAFNLVELNPLDKLEVIEILRYTKKPIIPVHMRQLRSPVYY